MRGADLVLAARSPAEAEQVRELLPILPLIMNPDEGVVLVVVGVAAIGVIAVVHDDAGLVKVARTATARAESPSLIAVCLERITLSAVICVFFLLKSLGEAHVGFLFMCWRHFMEGARSLYCTWYICFGLCLALLTSSRHGLHAVRSTLTHTATS